jgi:hypothetical protein
VTEEYLNLSVAAWLDQVELTAVPEPGEPGKATGKITLSHER